MKVIETHEDGTPRMVQLDEVEAEASTMFGELLDRGKGMIEAGEIVKFEFEGELGDEESFISWLIN